MSKLRKVQQYLYDGTIDSYNEIAKRFPREYFQLEFIDSNYQSSNIFTGSFGIYMFSMNVKDDNFEIVNKLARYSGLCVSPGNVIAFDIED